MSVKVTEVAKPEAPDAHGVHVPARSPCGWPTAEGPETRATAPFREFTLKKGHQRYVEVVGQLGDCEHYDAGSGEFIDSQPVKFKVLGQTLTDKIELPTRIEIRYTRATRCPR